MDKPSLTALPSGSRAATNASPHGALILTRADIERLMSPDDYLDAVEDGFRASAAGSARAPPPLQLHAREGAFHAKGALLESPHRRVAIKINSNFPGNGERNGLPTIQGAIVLFDAEDGKLIALMDSIEITLRRTAAASALAARFLARRDSSAIAICGCGAQARAQLAALAAILPLRKAYAWDLDPNRARSFAESMSASSSLDIQPSRTMREATLRSDIVLTSTTAREAFLGPGDVRPGSFVAAIGADNPEKSEIKPDLMRASSVFVDVLEQCLTMGDLHHAVVAGAMTASEVRAELADLVAGRKVGRTGNDEITIFDSTGTAIEDAAAAIAIYERASTAGIGTHVDLGRSLS